MKEMSRQARHDNKAKAATTLIVAAFFVLAVAV